jgi:cation transport ATPase
MGLLFQLAPRLRPEELRPTSESEGDVNGPAPNVASAEVDPGSAVTGDPPACLRHATFVIEGLSCRGCAHRAELLLGRIDGVRRARVSFVGEVARVILDASVCSEADVAAAMEAVGFRLQPAAVGAPSGRTEVSGPRLVAAGALCANVIALGTTGGSRGPGGGWMMLALAAATLAVAAGPLLRRARALSRRGTVAEDALAVLASAICLLAALAALALAGHTTPWLVGLGFRAEAWQGAVQAACLGASSIAFFALATRAVAAWVRARAVAALRALPGAARRIRGDHEEVTPAETLEIGDRVRLAQGDLAPAELRLETAARFTVRDARSPRGEAVVARDAGALVPMGALLLSGSTTAVVTDASAKLERARDAEVQRTLAQVDPQASLAWGRSDFCGAAARALGTATVALAGFALIAHAALGGGIAGPAPWLALAAVLAAASTAPLSLAGPIARVRAIARLRARQVVVREPSALDALSRIDHACIDDIESVTARELRVAGVAWTSEAPDRAALEEVLTSVRDADDPLSRAVSAYLTARGVVPAATSLCPRTTAALAETPGSAPASLRSERDAPAGAALPAGRAWFARGGVLLGHFELEAPLTADAVRAIAALTSRNIRCTLVGRGAGPAEKALAVRDAQHAGARVVFIGDGSSRAAVAAADASVAVSASGAPAELAGAIVIGSGLEAIAETVDAARAMELRQRRCLYLAAIYNAVLLPLAVTGLIGPLMAAAAALLLAALVLRIAHGGEPTRAQGQEASATGETQTAPMGAVLAQRLSVPPA